MTYVDIPELVVLSGPGSELSTIEQKLRDVGLTPPEFDGYELDPHDSHGLPSYTDPITAEQAGSPNAGHTPGTPHPEYLRRPGPDGPEDFLNPVAHHGEEYEPDPSIAFFTVAAHPDAAEAAVAGTPWVVRMHTAPHQHKAKPSLGELILQTEQTLEFLRSQVTTG